MAVVAALSSNASAQFGNQAVGGAGMGGTGIGGFGAQGLGGFGTTGLGTGTGQTGFGTNSAFGSTAGRTGTTGTTGTNSAFGSTTNRNATTTSRNTAGTTNSPFGTTNSQFGQTMNNTTGQQTGAMDNGSANFFQSQAGGRNGGAGGQNQLGNLFQNQFRAQTAFGANPLFNTNQQRKTGGGGQPSLRLGFDIPQRPAVEVEQGIESRLQAAATRPNVALETKLDIQGVRVDVADAGVVRLTGEVANDAARRRAANVIRLEPGVKKVINDITVAEAAK